MADEDFGRGDCGQGLVGFFDDGEAGGLLRGEGVGGVFGDVGEAAGDEGVEGGVGGEVGGSFEDVEEALVGCGAERAAGFEFGGVLGEGCAACGGDVDDGGGALHAGKGGADEGVGRVEEVVALIGAAGLTEVMHGLSLSFIIAQAGEELHCGGEGGFYVLRENVFVGVVAEAGGTAEEEHGGGDDGGENHGIVAGSAGDGAGWVACVGCGFRQESGEVWVEGNGGVV